MRLLIAPLVLAVALLGVPAWSSAEEGVRVTAEEEREKLKLHRVYGGITASGVAYMVVSRPGGDRDLYWNTFDRNGVWVGKSYMKGGFVCITYNESPTEKCYYSHRRSDGSLVNYLSDGTLSSTSTILYEGTEKP